MGGSKKTQAHQGPPINASSKDEENFIQCVYLFLPSAAVMLMRQQRIPQASRTGRQEGREALVEYNGEIDTCSMHRCGRLGGMHRQEKDEMCTYPVYKSCSSYPTHRALWSGAFSYAACVVVRKTVSIRPVYKKSASHVHRWWVATGSPERHHGKSNSGPTRYFEARTNPDNFAFFLAYNTRYLHTPRLSPAYMLPWSTY